MVFLLRPNSSTPPPGQRSGFTWRVRNTESLALRAGRKQSPSESARRNRQWAALVGTCWVASNINVNLSERGKDRSVPREPEMQILTWASGTADTEGLSVRAVVLCFRFCLFPYCWAVLSAVCLHSRGKHYQCSNVYLPLRHTCLLSPDSKSPGTPRSSPWSSCLFLVHSVVTRERTVTRADGEKGQYSE